jgi:hypothetical protein
MNMQVASYSNTNFKASPIRATSIKKFLKNGEITSVQATFVKLDKVGDLDAIKKSNKNYIKGDIMDSFCSNMEYCTLKNDTYYALVEQTKNFDKLIPSKILGVAEVTTRNKEMHIDTFQTCSKQVYFRNKYKHIGQTLMQNVVREAKEKKADEITLLSVMSAKPFYQKMQFSLCGLADFELPASDFHKTLSLT